MAPESHNTQLQRMVAALVEAGEAQIFRSPEGEPYIRVPIGNPARTVLSLNDREFKYWLARRWYQETGKGLGGGVIDDVVGTLRGSGLATKNVFPVFSRVAALEDRVYIDLQDTEYRVIQITKDDWTVCSCPDDVYFLRRNGMLALPVPTRGGNLCGILADLMRLDPKGQNVMMIAAWMVAAMRGKKPYPILVLSGEQGSGKSYACGIIRNCVDPNQANMSTKPNEPRDLLITARNSHIIGFDNLSYIDDWLSDILCSLATGAGYRTRTLTTDATETIFSAARPVIMNAIGNLIRRSDLGQRTIVVELKPIEETVRKTEAELDEEVKTLQPAIMGAIASAISQALRATVRPAKLPRLADFAVTVESAAPALGWEPGQFLSAYTSVQKDASAVLLEGDIVAVAVEHMMEEDGAREWEGPSEDLRDRLLGFTSKQRHDDFPKSTKALLNHLKRIAPLLRENGIQVDPPRQVKRGERNLRLMRISYPGAQAVLDLAPEKLPDL